MADDHMLETAAEWADRLDALDDGGRRALSAWLAADPAHATAFAAMRRLLADPALLDAATCEPAPLPMPAPRMAFRRRVRLPRPARRIALAAAGCAALAVALPAGWRTIAPAPVVRGDYASATATRRDARLPDGSTLALDAASRVAIAFSDDARRLDLRAGAARFDVRHDAARPFEVATPGARMTALGTNFSVERTPDGSELRVFRGRVRLDVAGRTSSVLGAGQWAAVTNGAVTLHRFDPARAATWQDDWLDGDAIPLATALARLQRYSDRPLRLADPALGGQAVDGRFRLDTPARSVALIAALFDLSVVRQGRMLCLTRGTRRCVAD